MDIKKFLEEGCNNLKDAIGEKFTIRIYDEDVEMVILEAYGGGCIDVMSTCAMRRSLWGASKWKSSIKYGITSYTGAHGFRESEIAGILRNYEGGLPDYIKDNIIEKCCDTLESLEHTSEGGMKTKYRQDYLRFWIPSLKEIVGCDYHYIDIEYFKQEKQYEYFKDKSNRILTDRRGKSVPYWTRTQQFMNPVMAYIITETGEVDYLNIGSHHYEFPLCMRLAINDNK